MAKTTQNLSQRFDSLENELRELQIKYKGQAEEVELKSARLKVKRLKKTDPITQEQNLSNMESEVYSWSNSGEQIVSKEAEDQFMVAQARQQSAMRIGGGLAASAVTSAAFGYVSTMSERSGDGIAERRIKKTTTMASKAASVGALALTGNVALAGIAAVGIAIQFGVAGFTEQAKIARINKDTAYRTSLMGPASYSGSR